MNRSVLILLSALLLVLGSTLVPSAVHAAPKDATSTFVANAICNIALGTQGCSANLNVTVTDTTNVSNIPQGTVNFTGLMPGTTGAHFLSNTCTLGSAGTCTVVISATSKGIAYTTATYYGDSTHNGSISFPASFGVTATIPFDYSLSTSPSSAYVVAGQSTTVTITATLTTSTSRQITLAASISPSPTVCAFGSGTSPCGSIAFSPTVVIPTNQGTNSTLTISTTVVVPAGTYTVTITGNPAGSSSSSATFTLTITEPGSPPPDFGILANPGSLNIQAGTMGTSTITISPSGGFHDAVDLTVTVSPSDPTTSLSVSTISSPLCQPCLYGYSASSATSSTLTVSVGSRVAAGTYTVTIHGTSGSLSHTKQITVTVTASQPAVPSNSNILGLTTTTFYALIGGIAVAVVAGSLVVVLRMRRSQTQP
jgi:hypothetical protein